MKTQNMTYLSSDYPECSWTYINNRGWQFVAGSNYRFSNFWMNRAGLHSLDPSLFGNPILSKYTHCPAFFV